ncbi:unnamed protein product [Bursaphelenchus okinawaensis]|uniref:HTH CENPB-type domain-containing protein n=1 Tax=Bursaphelenchus okinawaensis TaxID=465554 RepID=A0A811L2U1_9BILA|nr:unnamed protein product [Bursaphelenchus okinawaensis]CAG9117795.1 unnamed protein product [Bursaphelenchus okinawaensis]
MESSEDDTLLETQDSLEEVSASPSMSLDLSSLINLAKLDSNLNAQSTKDDSRHIKRRQRISLEAKKAIIELHDAKVPLKELSMKFGLTKSTISSVVNQRKLVEQAWSMGRQGKSSKLRRGKYPEVEAAVLDWIKEEREKDPEAQFPGLTIQDKATEISKALNVEFQASNGWLQRFKCRFRVFFKTNGERQLDPELAKKPDIIPKVKKVGRPRNDSKFGHSGDESYLNGTKFDLNDSESCTDNIDVDADEMAVSKWLSDLKEDAKPQDILEKLILEATADKIDFDDKSLLEKGHPAIISLEETPLIHKIATDYPALSLLNSTINKEGSKATQKSHKNDRKSNKTTDKSTKTTKKQGKVESISTMNLKDSPLLQIFEENMTEIPSLIEAIGAFGTLCKYLQAQPTCNENTVKLLNDLEQELIPKT